MRLKKKNVETSELVVNRVYCLVAMKVDGFMEAQEKEIPNQERVN